ncbi:hypothetical protein FRC15_011935 [Serendipita sp. 397]|nr:hypothetical protein FRC15_011935 [Serendipita sp. 397]KAG8797147.1 hypothetical protein FRC16_009183 [Serendipita sp. 398]
MSTRLSSKGSAASTPGSKLLSLRRSFGKLPRLSKELLYESIKQHPLPHFYAVESSGIASGSVPPKATVNIVLSAIGRSDQVAACPKAPGGDYVSSTPTLSAQRPFEYRSISVCHHQHNPMESMVDVPGGAASPLVSPLMLPAACCDSNLEVSVNPERTVKVARARTYKDSGISSESFFRDEGDDDVKPVNGWKQRGGLLYDALALPFRYSANKFRRNRRASDATTSTLDCESPVTPDGPSSSSEEAFWNASVEDQAGCDYSPILDYDIPKDRFGRELSCGRKIMPHGSISRQSSADTIIGVPLPSSVSIPRNRSLGVNYSPQAIDWNACTPLGLVPTCNYRAPQWLDDDGAGSLGPPPMEYKPTPMDSLIRQLTQPVPIKYFVPVKGLRFPLPLYCTPEDLAELSRDGLLEDDPHDGQSSPVVQETDGEGLNPVDQPYSGADISELIPPLQGLGVRDGPAPRERNFHLPIPTL